MKDVIEGEIAEERQAGGAGTATDGQGKAAQF